MENPDTPLQKVRASIARTCKVARRNPGEVTLVAVSKTKPASAIEPLLLEGHRVFGENRVQEAQKGGCPVGELPALLAQARDAGIPIAGLMCIPPLDIEPAPFFALLDRLARENGLEGRSMGMSDDFETAIRFGATSVRVGSAVFGARA